MFYGNNIMKFDIILADPAWTYSDNANSGQRGVSYKYPTMTIGSIKALPVEQVAADDSMLFLWGTWPLLKDCLDTVEAWGFRYKTGGFTWIKTSANGSPSMGMGSYTRSNSEFCLLAVRGNVKPSEWIVDRSVNSAIVAPRERHSKKPNEVIERIERLVDPGKSKLELFARESRQGWTSLGFDVNDGRDIRDTLPELIWQEG